MGHNGFSLGNKRCTKRRPRGYCIQHDVYPWKILSYRRLRCPCTISQFPMLTYDHENPILHLVEMPAKKQLKVNVMLVGQSRSGLHNKRTGCSVQERLHQKMKYSLQQAYFWNIDEASSSFWERDICNKMRNAMLFEKWSSLMHWCKLFAVAAALSALPPNATHLPKISARRGAGRKVVLYFMFLHY